jgi:hypothetical protein
MPFSHRLSRVLLSVAILAALAGAGYEADRHGVTARVVRLEHAYVAAVQKLWNR